MLRDPFKSSIDIFYIFSENENQIRKVKNYQIGSHHTFGINKERVGFYNPMESHMPQDFAIFKQMLQSQHLSREETKKKAKQDYSKNPKYSKIVYKPESKFQRLRESFKFEEEESPLMRRQSDSDLAALCPQRQESTRFSFDHPLGGNLM